VADDDQGGPLDVVVAEHALDHLIESGDADRLEVGEFVFDLYERDRVVEGHVEGRVERLVGSRAGDSAAVSLMEALPGRR